MDILVPYDKPTLADALASALAGDTIRVEATYDSSKEGPLSVPRSVTIAGRNGRAKIPALGVLGTLTLELRAVEVAGSTLDEGGIWSIGQVGGGLVLDDVVFTSTKGRAVSAAFTWIEARDVVADGFANTSAFYLYGADAHFTGGSFSGNQGNVFVAVGSTLVVEGARFADNSALGTTTSSGDTAFVEGSAGADVLAFRSSVWLVDTIHERSTAAFGGAVLTVDGALDIDGATFKDTEAVMVGGAVAMVRQDDDGDGLEDGPGTRFSIVDTTFSGSTAGAAGALALLDATGELRSVVFTDSEAVGNPSYGGGPEDLVAGGAIAAFASTFTAEDVTIDGASATAIGGGILLSQSDAALRNVVVTGAQAAYGGAIAAGESSVSLDGAFLYGNTATAIGGALLSSSPVSLDVRRSRLCANTAPQGAAIGVFRGAPEHMALINTRVVQNTGGAAVTILPDEVSSGGAPFVAENVTFVDNSSALDAWVGAVQVTNALVIGGEKGSIAPQASVSIAYSGFYGVDAPEGANAGEGNLEEADPRFHEPISCEATLHLGPGSPARDAGHPDITDVDGTRSDFGAWGGPGSELSDGDGDGHFADQDCDDADPDAFPGAPEVWYDGRDGDCAGGDDHDQDGDGFGLGAGDCDDRDPDRHPDAVDVENDRIDQDCDGVDDGRYEWLSSGNGCATSPGGGLAAAMIGALLIRRRRGRQG